MPMPPILPTVDWKAVFGSGVEFRPWLHAAENPDHRKKMESAFANLKLGPAREAFLKSLERTAHVVAIAEDWCGDVVRFAPVLARIAAESGDKVKVRFIRRDQHPDVFVRYLTNGGEAIPKFVFLNETFVECGNWGPMPSDCRRVISRGKGANDVAAARARVSKMYESDPNFETAIRELLDLVDTAVCSQP
jgi:hypothetical protein